MKLHSSLPELLQDSWQLLSQGAEPTRHPFHTPTVATGQKDEFSVRIIVLRATTIAERQLTFYTDIRTPKIRDLRENPRMVWHFYDPSEKVQIRATGKARIHHQDELSQTIWQTIPVRNRKDYCALQAPGIVVENSQAAIPPIFKAEALSIEKTDYGYQNFAVVITTIEALDWLHLSREEHQRARFSWQKGQWEGEWIVP